MIQSQKQREISTSMSGPSIQTKDHINQMDIKHRRNTVVYEPPASLLMRRFATGSGRPFRICALLAAAPSKGRQRSSGDLWASGIRAQRLANKIRPFRTLPYGVRFSCCNRHLKCRGNSLFSLVQNVETLAFHRRYAK